MIILSFRCHCHLLAAICLLITIPANAQRVFYNQAHTNALLLNPGYTGSTGTHRLTGAARVVWPKLDVTQYYYNLAFDTELPFMPGAFGVISNLDHITDDQDEFYNAITYAYAIDLNDEMRVVPGIKLGLIHTRREVFLTMPGNPGFPQIPLQTETATNTVGDLSAGFVVQGYGINAGLAVNHINTPDVSVFEPFEFNVAKLWNIHLTYDWKISDEVTLAPFVRYDRQNDLDRWQFMVSANYRWIYVGTGYDETAEIWMAMAGVTIKNKLRINYGLDYDTSDVFSFSDTGGNHEIALQFLFGGSKGENPAFGTIAF
ncbi:MAG: PorP/SprF family type IX secretion system membrane protein [Bacteroidota bacterium]